MKKIIQQTTTILSLLLILTNHVIAQKKPLKFGNVSIEDLEVTSYAQDTSTAAIILYDYGEGSIGSSSRRYELKVHRRIKVLNKEGYSWADFEKKVGKDEYITNIKAAAHIIENGKQVTYVLDKHDIYKKKSGKYSTIYSFTLPNVKEGAIIEYAYTYSSDQFFSPPAWYFQNSIPTMTSEYRIYFPDGLEYRPTRKGGFLPVINQSEALYSRLIYKNIPAFISEPYMTSSSNFMPQVKFQLQAYRTHGGYMKTVSKTWNDIARVLKDTDQYGWILTNANPISKKSKSIIEGLQSDQEKIEAIYSYVQHNMSWNDRYSIWLSDSPTSIFKKKEGNVADINFMLVQMLRASGFDAHPIICGTRSEGWVIKSYPLLENFHYVIAYVKLGEKTLLLDATDSQRPSNILNFEALNGSGLLFYVDKPVAKWLPIKSTGRSLRMTTAKVTISEDGELSGNLTIAEKGYPALDTRNEIRKLGEEAYANSRMKEALQNGEIDDYTLENVDAPKETLKTSVNITTNSFSETGGDFIYISPMLGQQLEENPFKLEERLYPVNFGYQLRNIYTVNIDIPEGFVVETLPETAILALPNQGGLFQYQTKLLGNKIMISSNIQLNKSVYLPSDYPYLKEIFTQIIAKQAEQIILKRQVAK